MYEALVVDGVVFMGLAFAMGRRAARYEWFEHGYRALWEALREDQISLETIRKKSWAEVIRYKNEGKG